MKTIGVISAVPALLGSILISVALLLSVLVGPHAPLNKLWWLVAAFFWAGIAAHILHWIRDAVEHRA